jgi:hypothetical protein
MMTRYRNKKLNLRLNQEEYDYIKNKVEQSEFKSRQAYLISQLHKAVESTANIKSIDVDFSYYCSKVNEIGNEINDITRLFNMTSYLDKDRYEIAIAKLNNITKKLVNKIRQI